MNVEQFLDGSIAYLRANLPARIAAVNAEHADDGHDIVLGVPVDDGGLPGTGGVAYSTGADPILSYPWVEVAVPDGVIDELSLGQVDGTFRGNVVVRLWVQDPRPPMARVDRSIKRFGRAVVETLMTPGAFAAGAWVESIRFAYRVDPQVDEGTGPVAAATFAFTIGAEAMRP